MGSIDQGVINCIDSGGEVAACLSASSQVSTSCIPNVYTAYDSFCGHGEGLYGSTTTTPTQFVQCALGTLALCEPDDGTGCYDENCRTATAPLYPDCPVPVYPPVTGSSTVLVAATTSSAPLQTMTDSVSYCDEYAPGT